MFRTLGVLEILFKDLTWFRAKEISRGFPWVLKKTRYFMQQIYQAFITFIKNIIYIYFIKYTI